MSSHAQRAFERHAGFVCFQHQEEMDGKRHLDGSDPTFTVSVGSNLTEGPIDLSFELKLTQVFETCRRAILINVWETSYLSFN